MAEEEIKKDAVMGTSKVTHRERQQRAPEISKSKEDGPYRESGALIGRTDTADELWEKRASNAALAWPRFRHWLRKPFSEFMGTFILIMFGDGVVAQVVLSNETKGDYQSISWGWVSSRWLNVYKDHTLTRLKGLGVMLGVYTSGISGAHINPAVTFANCVFRKFPWKDFLPYAFAQILGAFLASGVVYANYKSAIDVYEGGAGIRTVSGPNATAGIFCTYPQPFMTTTGMFFDEFIGSTLLMFLIYVLKDDANLGAGPLTPLGLFFIIFGIGACFGYETGYAINLARDFGPRLMSFALGYGNEVWTAGNHYFWVSYLVPVVPSHTVARSSMHQRGGIANRSVDPDGYTVLGLHVRRLLVRSTPLHRREPNQHALHGSVSLRPLDR